MDAREFTNGMHLIPLDQDKEPTCGRGFLDEANYEQNTQKVIPGEMYGVLTGRPNRVLVIDWDCYGGKCEFELTEEMLTRKVGGEGVYRQNAIRRVPHVLRMGRRTIRRLERHGGHRRVRRYPYDGQLRGRCPCPGLRATPRRHQQFTTDAQRFVQFP